MRVPGFGWRLAVLVGVVVLIFLRAQDAFLLPQLRAEDGTHFFTQARRLGLESLGATCNGYHVLFGRLVAWAASFAPPEHAPLIYSQAALLAMLCVAVFAMSARAGSRWPALAALALALVPGRGAVYLHLTDVQTVLAAGLVLLLIAREPASRRQLAGDLIYCALAGLTGPHALVLLPLFALRAVLRRTRASLATLGVLLVAGAIQARALIGDPRLQGVFDATDPDWLSAIGMHIAGMMLPGETWVRALSPALLAGASVLVVAFVFVASSRARNARPALLTGAALIVLAAVYSAHRDAPRFLTVTAGNQYSYLPLLFLVWALLDLAVGRGPAARVAQGLLCLCLVSTLTDFRREPLPDRHWSRLAAHIGSGVDCNIPVHPGRNLWYVQYRASAEGREPAPDMLARIVAEALPAQPTRIDPRPLSPMLTFHQGEGYLDVPLSVRLVYELAPDARRFEIRVGLRPQQGAGDDTIEFRLEFEPADGSGNQQLQHLVIRPLHDLVPGLDDPDALIMTMETNLPREPGRLVVHARSAAADSAWGVLWGGAQFTGSRSDSGSPR